MAVRLLTAFWLVSVFAARSLAGPLPEDLERLRAEASGKLAAEYGVPSERLREPISVDFVRQGETVPVGWGGLPAYAAGAAEPASGRVIILEGRTGRYPFGDTSQVLRHELSHVFLHRALGYAPPRWLDEGLAMRASSEWGRGDEFFLALALFKVARGSYGLRDLDADFRAGESPVRRSYALAGAFVRDLFGDGEGLGRFLARARETGSVEVAFGERFGIPPEAAFRRWARDLPWWGEWIVFASSPGLLWGLVGLLFLLAALASWRRRRRVYEQLPD